MSTYTFTGTGSYTVADVKAVMQNTYEDIIGFANRQNVEYDDAEKWIDDLTYLLNKKAVKYFELQLYSATGDRFKSYRYDVDTWGQISSGDKSGGINYYEIPKTTKIRLYADLDGNNSEYHSIIKELTDNRGWGTNGTSMEGTTTYERNYVSNSLQLKRSIITK